MFARPAALLLLMLIANPGTAQEVAGAVDDVVYLAPRWEKGDQFRLNVERRREDNEIVRFLSDGERERLLQACRACAWNLMYLLTLLALTTGAWEPLSSTASLRSLRE